MKEQKRIEWIDIIKFIAIFMMIAVHCTDNVTPAERSEPWYILWGSIYGSLLRPAIPLFLIATGALLLPVKESILTFYNRRMMRVVIPFLIWSVLYNLFPWVTGLLGLDPSVINDFFAWAVPSQRLSDALYNIAMIPFNFSAFAVQMWYVYALIGIYLYLPFFSAWVKNSTKDEQHIFLILWVISLTIPFLRQYLSANLWGVCSWNEFGMLYSFAGFNGYLLLGYYLRNYKFDLSWGRVALISIPMFAVGYCVTFFGFKSIVAVAGQPESLVELFYTYCSPNVLMMTIPLVLVAQKIKLQSAWSRRVVTSISICTFGIWMSHYMFLGPVYMLIEDLPLHVMVKMIISSILLLVVTWAFVSLVLRCKRVGRWIMG